MVNYKIFKSKSIAQIISLMTLAILCFFPLKGNANEVFEAMISYTYQSCSPQGVTIAFEDASNSTGITAWLWEFSDGQSASSQNPVLSFNSSQMLGVRLTITLSDGTTESTTETLDIVLMDNINIPAKLLLCPGGAIPLNPSGNPNYTYSWSPSTGLNNPNAANPLASPSETTTYTVTITDNSGSAACEQIKTVEVFVAPPIPLGLEQDFTACGNEATLSVDTDPGLHVNWYDVSAQLVGTGHTITVMPTGRTIYFAEVLDEFGCSAKDAIVVTQADPPTVAATPTNPPCGATDTGTATAAAADGKAPYSYAWSNGQTGETITGLAPGAYTVTATDANGCTAETTVTLVQTSPISVSASTGDPVCNGSAEGTATASATDGLAPYTYTWSNGQTGEMLSGLAPGAYTVTATDANGCTAETSITITERSPINLTTASTDVTEMDGTDGTASVSPDGGTEPYTYEWSNGATTAEVSGLAAGTYTVTVTDANGCKSTATVMIESPLCGSVNITADLTNNLCNGDNNGAISLAVEGLTGELTYKWGDGITTGDRNNLPAGTYDVSVSDGNMCEGTASFTITEPMELSTIISSVSSPPCSGESTASAGITVSGGTTPYTFNWSNGEQSSSITDVPAGEYNITVTDANSCQTTAMVSISEPPPVVAQVAFDYDECQTENIAVSFSGSSNVDNVTSWNWTLADGTKLEGQNPMFTLGNPMDLEVTLNIVTADGCEAAATMPVKIETFQPSALMESTTVCPGKSTQLNPGSFNPDYNYQWSPSEGLSNPNAGNPVATVMQSTEFVLTISSANGQCEVQDTIMVMVPPPIELTTAGDTSLCETSQVQISAMGENISSIEWSDAEDFSNIISNENIVNVSPDNTTTYFVRVTDENNCTESSSVKVENNAIQVALNGQTRVCKNDVTTLDNQVQNLAAEQELTYDWGGNSIIVDGANSGSPTVQANENTVLNVNITNQFGCEYNDDVSVEVVDVESSVATATPEKINKGESSNLTTTGPAEASYTWTPAGSLDNPNVANPTATPEETTTYTVSITTPEGCATTRDVTVTVSPVGCQPPFIFFPNAFTPNGDGENDVLFLRGNSIKDMRFVIYNRWGEKVFESTNLQSGWDGTFKGEKVCPDVYGYYLEATCTNGEEYYEQGNVTVLK